MKRLLFIFTMIDISVLSVSAQSDYYIKKAQSYQREAVAATISITNTLRFSATSAGVHGMAGIVSRSRERLYSCMAAPDFDAEEANENFFDDEK